MHHHILAQAGTTFTDSMISLLIGLIVVFFISLYIFRAIFNIPSFLRYQKAQIRLLKEIAKTQGVDNAKVEQIISETHGWDGADELLSKQ